MAVIIHICKDKAPQPWGWAVDPVGITLYL